MDIGKSLKALEKDLWSPLQDAAGLNSLTYTLTVWMTQNRLMMGDTAVASFTPEVLKLLVGISTPSRPRIPNLPGDVSSPESARHTSHVNVSSSSRGGSHETVQIGSHLPSQPQHPPRLACGVVGVLQAKGAPQHFVPLQLGRPKTGRSGIGT